MQELVVRERNVSNLSLEMAWVLYANDHPASADRRPVDPPPVVELRIFEGEGPNRTDITFSYDANFFCFVNLQLARPIAHGRVQQPPQQPPVLTGMPVSGMAYLDRPAEAGYFIFPDLSVRHEGKYCLGFVLYEHTKNAKDQDADLKEVDKHENGSFDFISEVKSAPFTVFSAKKFPGLAESTILSRTVAEQGCRVRIRRDVRMRRREGKGGADYDDYGDEGYSRARSMTPVDPSDYSRQRSISNSSIDRQAYEPRRRPSAYADQSYPPAPQQPQAFLGFGGPSAPQPQFQTPQFAPPSKAASQPQQQYPTYHQASQFRQQQQQQQQQPAPFYQHDYKSYPRYGSLAEGYNNDYRRPSTYGAAPPLHAEQDTARPAANYPPYQPRTEQPVLAPIQVAPAPPVEPKRESLTSPAPSLSANNHASSSLASPGYQDRPYSSFTAPAASEPRGSKRSFVETFPSSTYTQPLHNGMRPTSSHGNSRGFDDTEEVGIDAFTMQYRRADGSSHNRELPSLS